MAKYIAVIPLYGFHRLEIEADSMPEAEEIFKQFQASNQYNGVFPDKWENCTIELKEESNE